MFALLFSSLPLVLSLGVHGGCRLVLLVSFWNSGLYFVFGLSLFILWGKLG